MTIVRPRALPAAKPKAVPTALAEATVLDVPFAMRAQATSLGAKYDAALGAFVFTGAALPKSLSAFRPARYSFEERVQRTLGTAGAWPTKRGSASAGPRPTLRPHQVVAVAAIAAARAAKRPGFLLADDVGLGKTITAWEALRGFPDVRSVLVVCPLAVVAHWRRTIELLGDGGKEVVLLNYDRLGKLFEVTAEAKKKIRSKKGLARAGTAPAFDAVVWDESHRCKNPAAARSKLAAKLTAKAGFALWLSATAGQTPLELSYLAPLLASVTGARAADLKDFEAFCQREGLGLSRGTFGRWEWRGDPADCEKVRALLFDARGKAPAAGLRRRPEEIAGWPALQRILTPVELDAPARALYDEAWSTFRREMDLDPSGRDPKTALAAALRLRQKSSLIRMPGTVELATELLENGHQVAISVAFTETLSLLQASFEAEQVPCAVIHGSLTAAAREAERVRFQRGDAKVVLFTVEEGISLHQGEVPGKSGDAQRSQVVHDLRWSAIQMAQIEGRCHRDGKFAQVYWVYADETVEERIARVVAGRIQSMKEMIGDDVETLREIERLLAEP